MCVCDDGFRPKMAMVGCVPKDYSVFEDDDDVLDALSVLIEMSFFCLAMLIMFASWFLLGYCVYKCTKQTNPEVVDKKPEGASTPSLAADSAPKPSN